MENNEQFSFTYSAEQQKEIEAIRSKYIPKEEDELTQLRRLHAVPTKKAKAASITVGVIGALIMGTGMSLAMTDLGEILGSHRDRAMVIGIAVGLIGMLLVALAYPIYNRVLKKQREKIAPEILRLSNALLK